MNVEYYNIINQLPLVNNWCVAVKLYKFYIIINTELIDNTNIAKFYYKNGFDEKKWGLCSAAHNGYIHMVNYYIRNIVYSDFHLSLGLLYAVRGGHLDIVKFFIEKLQIIRNKDLCMLTAADCGHLDIVKFFIENGATDVDNSMMYAASTGHLNIINYLIQHGANDWNGGLMCAVEGGQLDTVKFFINKGATDWGEAMYTAAEDGRYLIVKFFVGIGANNYRECYHATRSEAIKKYLRPYLCNINN